MDATAATQARPIAALACGLFGTAGVRLDHPCVLLAALVLLRTATTPSPQTKNKNRDAALVALHTAFVDCLTAALNRPSSDPRPALIGEDGLTWWQRVLPITDEIATANKTASSQEDKTSFAKRLRSSEFQSLTTAERELLAALAQNFDISDIADRATANPTEAQDPDGSSASNSFLAPRDRVDPAPRSFRSSRWGIGGGGGGSAAAALFSKPDTASALFASRTSVPAVVAATTVAMPPPSSSSSSLWLPQFSTALLSAMEGHHHHHHHQSKLPMSVAAWLGIACSLEQRRQFFRRHQAVAAATAATPTASSSNPGSHTWHVFCRLRAALWLTPSTRASPTLPFLCEILSDVAKETFRETKHPDDVALIYAALGKTRVLSAMFKSTGSRKVAQFLSEYAESASFIDNDGDDGDGTAQRKTMRGNSVQSLSRQAVKNASALMRAGRPRLAAAFFLLARPPKVREALHLICSRRAEGGRRAQSQEKADHSGGRQEREGGGDPDLGLVIACVYDNKLKQEKTQAESSHVDFVLERWFRESKPAARQIEPLSASSAARAALVHFNEGNVSKAVAVLATATASSSATSCSSRISVSSLASSSPLSLGSSVNPASLAEAIIDRATLPGLLQQLARAAAATSAPSSVSSVSSSLSPPSSPNNNATIAAATLIQSLLVDLKTAGANQVALLLAPAFFPSPSPRSKSIFALCDAVDAAARVLLRQTTLPWIRKAGAEKYRSDADLPSEAFLRKLLRQLTARVCEARYSNSLGDSDEHYSTVCECIRTEAVKILRVGERWRTSLSLCADKDVPSLNMNVQRRLSLRYDLNAVLLLCGGDPQQQSAIELSRLAESIESDTLAACARLRKATEGDHDVVHALLRGSMHADRVARLLWQRCDKALTSSSLPAAHVTRDSMLACAHRASQCSRVGIFTVLCVLCRTRRTDFGNLHVVLLSFLGGAAVTVADRRASASSTKKEKRSAQNNGSESKATLEATVKMPKGGASTASDIEMGVPPPFLDQGLRSLLMDTLASDASAPAPVAADLNETKWTRTAKLTLLVSRVLVASALSRFACLEKRVFDGTSPLFHAHLDPWCEELHRELRVSFLAEMQHPAAEQASSPESTSTLTARVRDFQDMLTFMRLLRHLRRNAAVTVVAHAEWTRSNKAMQVGTTPKMPTTPTTPTTPKTPTTPATPSFMSGLSDSFIAAVTNVLAIPVPQHQPPTAAAAAMAESAKDQKRVEGETGAQKELPQNANDKNLRKKDGLRGRLARSLKSSASKLHRTVQQRQRRLAKRLSRRRSESEAAAKCSAEPSPLRPDGEPHFYTEEAIKWLLSDGNVAADAKEDAEEDASPPPDADDDERVVALNFLDRLARLGLIEISGPHGNLQNVAGAESFRACSPRRALACDPRTVDLAMATAAEGRARGGRPERDAFCIWSSTVDQAIIGNAKEEEEEEEEEDGVGGWLEPDPTPCVFPSSPSLLPALFGKGSTAANLWSVAHTSSFLFSLLGLPRRTETGDEVDEVSDGVESGGLGLLWASGERTRDESRPSDSSGNENEDKNTLASHHAPPSSLTTAALHMGLLWRFGFDAHRVVWQIHVDILGVTFDQSGALPEERRSGEFSSTFVSATVGLEDARDRANGADCGESKSRQGRAYTSCCSETVVLAVNRPRKSSSFWEVAGGDEGNDKIVFQVPVPVAKSFEEALVWWSGETGFVGGSDELTGGGYLVAAPPSTLSVVVTEHAEDTEGEEEEEQEDRRVGRANIGMNHLVVDLERMMGTGLRWPVVCQGDVPFDGADDGCRGGGGSVRIRVKQCVSIVSGSDPVRDEELEEEEEQEEQEEKLGSSSLRKSAASVSCDFDKSVTRLGMVLQPLSAIEGQQKRGCYIQKVHPGTAAAARGLRAGMTLEYLNGVDGVASLAFSAILTRLKQRPTSTRWVQTFSSRNLPHGSI